MLFYIIHMYGWELDFTNIIKMYDKPKPLNFKLYCTHMKHKTLKLALKQLLWEIVY